MIGFEKCEIPCNMRPAYSYGSNQNLIQDFAKSGFKCAKVTGFDGKVETLGCRLTACAKKLNMPHIKAMKFNDDIYLVNMLIKED